MYDEKIDTKTKPEKMKKEKKSFHFNVNRFNVDWKSILKKFGILTIAVFTVIFITTKTGQNSEKKYLEKSLDTMKTGAYNYFKEFDKPETVNEEVTVSLQDLINSDVLEPITDKKGNTCDTESSMVSIKKQTNTKYNLVAHLNCNEIEKEKEYDLIYATNSNTEKNDKTIFYKLQKEVSNDNFTYSCPSGYTLNGSNCFSNATTLTVKAIERFKTTSAKTTKATYKKPSDTYQYVEPVETVKEESYVCDDKSATLVGKQCIISKDASMKEEAVYSCKEGTLEGTKCVITKDAIETDYKYYCSSGKLVENDKCELKRDYIAKYDCPDDYPNRDGNQCYFTEKADRDYGDWHYKGTKSFYYEKDSTKTTKYDEIDSYESSNGRTKYVYKYYTKSKEYICDDDGTLKGSRCYYYTDAYKTKDCSNDYDLNEDETKCIKIVDAKKKKTNTSYICDDGFSKKGSGSNTACVKKTDALKIVNKIPTCDKGFKSVQNTNGSYSCVKSSDAKKLEERKEFVCPTGYESSGNGDKLKCFIKTPEKGYFYCKNTEAILDGEVCTTTAKTELIGYKCPNGYDLNDKTCVKIISGKSVNATKTNHPIIELSYKWSKNKTESGWTFTGETKEE